MVSSPPASGPCCIGRWLAGSIKGEEMKRRAMRNLVGRALLVLGLAGGAVPLLSTESTIVPKRMNAIVDNDGPVAQILSPAYGTEVPSSFGITVAAYDELSSVSRLYVLTNSAVYLHIQNPSAQETVSCGLPYGSHTIGAYAVDSLNHTGATHTISVTRTEPRSDAFGVTIGVPADYAGREIRLRLDSETGPVVGSLTVQETGGWTVHVLQCADLEQEPSGRHKIFLTFHGSSTVGNIKDIRVFHNGAQTPAFTGHDAVSSQGVTISNGVISGGGTGDWVEFPEYDFDTMSLVKEGGVIRAVIKTSSHSGYLEYLPPGYGSTTEDYPCMIFLHGFGERGSGSEADLAKVSNTGPFQRIKSYGHTMTFTVGGKQESFIVIGPQSDAQGCMPPAEFKSVYDHILGAYRIDKARVYLTGLSYGGQGSYEWAGSALNATNVIAAMGIMSATTVQETAVVVGSRNIPIWAHHGDQDSTAHWYGGAVNTINWINSAHPIPAPIFTVYPGVGHSAWNQGYRTDHSLHTPNLYEWFLSHRLRVLVVDVDVGPDQSISLPADSITLPSAIKSTYPIATYVWEKKSGPAVILVNAHTPTLTVNGLAGGTYVFRLTATDSQGKTGYNEVMVTVSPLTQNYALSEEAPLNMRTHTEEWSEGRKLNTKKIRRTLIWIK
jgi:hypothetical protein